MNSAQLKLLVFGIWTGILLIGGFLIYWAFLNADTIFAPVPTPANLIVPTLPPLSTSTPIPPTPIVSSTPTRRPTFTPIPTNTSFVLPAVQFNATLAPNVDPLTGLRVDDLSRLDRRPVAVKITHFPRHIRAWQKGLSRADVAYEYYIEDGLTRFIAIFYGQDAEQAGPVRSGRYFDEHIARMYHSTLVFANADDRVEKYFLESDLLPFLVVPRDDNCPPLCRDKKINDFNNFFVNTAGVAGYMAYAQHDNSHQDLRPTFFYGLLSPWAAPEASHIYVHYSGYSYGYWEYDASAHLYRRYSDAADALNGAPETYWPQIDILTGAQVSANNVIVLFVPHTFHNQYDFADQVYDIKLIGEGRAFLFRDGRMIEARWVRDQIDQPIMLLDSANQPVPISPGVTFYQVFSDLSGYEILGSDWHFHMALPSRPTPAAETPTPTKTKKP